MSDFESLEWIQKDFARDLSHPKIKTNRSLQTQKFKAKTCPNVVAAQSVFFPKMDCQSFNPPPLPTITSYLIRRAFLHVNNRLRYPVNAIMIREKTNILITRDKLQCNLRLYSIKHKVKGVLTITFKEWHLSKQINTSQLQMVNKVPSQDKV